MNNYNNTLNINFIKMYSECLVNSSKFCELYKDDSIYQTDTCAFVKGKIPGEFNDNEQIFCHVLLSTLFLARYCIDEHNTTMPGSTAKCVDSFTVPFSVCNHQEEGSWEFFLTQMFLSCFHFFAYHTDLTLSNKMTQSEMFWFTMDNTCKQPNASRFGMCRGHVYLQENVFNITKLLQSEVGWFYTKYIYPSFSISVVVMNVLFVLSIIKTDIIRPTKFIMYALAFVETVVSVGFLPAVVYYIILGNYVLFVPYTLCILIMMVLLVFVPIMHGLFLWLVAGLAAQRLFVVSYPFLASHPKHKTSIRRPLAYVLIISIVLFAVYIPTIQKIFNTPSMEVPMKSDIYVSLTTSLLPKVSVSSPDGITSGVALILQRVGAQILPTSILLFACIRLSFVIRKQKAIQKSLSEVAQQKRSSLDKVNIVTLTVTTFVLLSEVPNNILSVITCLNFTGVSHIDTSSYPLQTLVVVSNVFVSVSYQANFIASCFAGKVFRDSVKSVIQCSKTDN